MNVALIFKYWKFLRRRDFYELSFPDFSLPHFRKRFHADLVNRLNESVTASHRKQEKSRNVDDSDDEKPMGGNGNSGSPSDPGTEESSSLYKQGKLLTDATCAPSDIVYPRDICVGIRTSHNSSLIQSCLRFVLGPGTFLKDNCHCYRIVQLLFLSLNKKLEECVLSWYKKLVFFMKIFPVKKGKHVLVTTYAIFLAKIKCI